MPHRSPNIGSLRRLLVAVLALAAVAVPAAAIGGSSKNPYGPSAPGQRVRGYLVKDPAAYRQAKAKTGSAQRFSDAPGTRAHPHVAWGGVSQTDVTPPDTTGAIGTTRYIELINLMFGIYDRNGNAISSGSLGALTGDNVDNLSDPQVIWDPDTSRFYYAVLDFNSDNMEIGFSKTDSPSGAADFCKYDVDFGYGADLPDFPKLGDTKDFLLIGANVFAGGFFYDRSDVMWVTKPAAGTITTCPAAGTAGWPGSTGVKQNLLNSDSTQAFTPVPANQIDSSSTGYVVASYDPYTGSPNKLEVFPVTKNSSGTANIAGTASAVSVSTFSIPSNAPQPGTNAVLDTSDARLTQAVSAIDPARGGAVAIWTQHTVAGGAGAQVRWYEINPAGLNLFQSGTVSSSSLYAFNAAISPDRVVNGATTAFGSSMALGFNTSSSSANPAIQMVTKVGNGAQSSFQLIKQSPGPNIDYSCSPCRWGDYSGATPDPAANAFASAGQVWLSNQYNRTSSNQTVANWLTWNWSVALGPGGGSGAPTITGFNPTSGPRGSQVTITGTNFVNVSAVQLTDGTHSASASFTVNSPTQITATVPTMVPIGVSLKWKVTTPSGSAVSTSSFTITSGSAGGSAPTISGFSPTSGPGGTVVTITGTNFVNVTSVALVNGTRSMNVPFIVDSATQIRATMPTGAPSGASAKIKVTTSAGSVTSAGSFIFS